MNRYNHYNVFTTRGYIYRTLISVAAIFVLVFFMPRGNELTMEFKMGRPWNYGEIIAKENFPILKSDSVLQQEHDSLMRMYRPIYEMDADVATKQLEAFKHTFDTKLRPSVPSHYRAHLIEKLKKVYQAGIIPADEYDQLRKDKVAGIVVSVLNMGNAQGIEEIYTPKTAYKYLITEQDSTHYQKSVLMRCDLSRFVEPNLTYDEERSKSQFENIEKQLVRYSGQVLAGQKIIEHGDIVDENTYNILRSMQIHREERERSATERFSQLGGQIIYASIFVICLLVFFNQFRSDYLQRPRTIALIVLLTLVFPLTTYALVKNSLLSVYLIPYCILPIFLRVFLDSRTAFITHVTSIMLSAAAMDTPHEFIVVQLVAGLVAIYSLRQLSQRSELLIAVLIVVAASLLCHLCFELIHMSIFTKQYDYGTYLFIIFNGFLLFIAYLLLFPFERLFKFTSMVTLVELSNTNNEVLRRLSEEAPGTFQHSMQVANLAGEVANTLGAKSQLVRTGALYHDIGKLSAPVFFTENQNGQNPHDNLSYVKSAQIIINHVKNGLELAEKYRLPEVIRQFIATHHGCSKAKYFYIKYKNENPLLAIDEKFFTYPGPNPFTIEQAILMMCDSVEAASRSLSEYTEESISGLVNRIIDSQVSEGYFNNCPITFQDIAQTKQVLTQKLMTTYHTRISYPELEKN